MRAFFCGPLGDFVFSPSVPHYGGSLPSGLLLGDVLAHVGVGLDVLHLVVIHDTEIAVAERLGHCQRYLCFGLYDLCAGLLGLCLHLLLQSHGHCPALLCTGLCDVLVGISLVHLEYCTDILSYINIRYVDGQNLESGTCIQTLGQNHLGN